MPVLHQYFTEHVVQSSITGQFEARELGPFWAIVPGCFHQELTLEQVEQYVLRVHGVRPLRVVPVEAGKGV